MFSCEPMLTSLTLSLMRRSARAYSSSSPLRPVIRRVVGDDKLEVSEVLRDDRFDAPPDDIHAVSYGEADRECR